MKKKFLTTKRNYILILALVFLVLALMGCNKKNEEGSTADTNIITVHFLAVDQEEKTLANLDISFTSNDELIEKLKKDAGMVIKDDMVIEISGVAQNKEENLYWLFTVNEEDAARGFSELEYKNDDIIVFTLTDVSK